MNTEERQLSDLLHRITPEPPRRVTVEDVAFRLANQPELARAGGRKFREPKVREPADDDPRDRPASSRPSSRPSSQHWAPLAAAAAVLVVAGASAGIAFGLSSHNKPASPGPVAGGHSSAAAASSSASSAPTQSASDGPTFAPRPVAGGMWGAALIDRQTLGEDSLASGDGSLYAVSSGSLVRISPVTGNILQQVPDSAPVPNPPVVSGGTVWVVSSYGGSQVVLKGYNAKTLAPAGSVTVPADGSVSATAEGVLTSGSGGYLYVAAGSSVVVVNPSNHSVIKRIDTSAPANSVAVAPDGSKLYVSAGPADLLVYNPATGAQVSSSSTSGDGGNGAGNLVATPGGLWGTTGEGMAQWTWFAPGGNMVDAVRVTSGAGGGLASVPAYSGGAVWIGGSHTLACASPSTGKVLDSVTVPTDGGVLEYFGSLTVTGGKTYSYYENNRAQEFGVATLDPPGACTS